MGFQMEMLTVTVTEKHSEMYWGLDWVMHLDFSKELHLE